MTSPTAGAGGWGCPTLDWTNLEDRNPYILFHLLCYYYIIIGQGCQLFFSIFLKICQHFFHNARQEVILFFSLKIQLHVSETPDLFLNSKSCFDVMWTPNAFLF